MIDEKAFDSRMDSTLSSRVKMEDGICKVNAEEIRYQRLNRLLEALKDKEAETIEFHNVYGQRYIGTNLRSEITIKIYGISWMILEPSWMYQK